MKPTEPSVHSVRQLEKQSAINQPDTKIWTGSATLLWRLHPADPGTKTVSPTDPVEQRHIQLRLGHLLAFRTPCGLSRLPNRTLAKIT